jgi:hypothetical protein
MTSKSHNAKKPKLAGHHLGGAHDPSSVQASPDSPLSEGTTPEKHKMSFAQHQHEQQSEHNALPLPEAPTHHLKSDAQQHQQKGGSHR